jgi:hypothetical protein
VLGEQLGRRAADAARGPGDDRHLAVENSHWCLQKSKSKSEAGL